MIMIRLIVGGIVAFMAATISGCISGSGTFGWVTDSDHYCEMSGFSVQAPIGANWYRVAKNENFPNRIAFVKAEPTPIRFNPYHPEFTITSVAAYGVAIGGRVPRSADKDAVREALQQGLQQYQVNVGINIQNSSYDDSLGAVCLKYKGKPVNPDVNSEYGVIRYESVTGYFCLHPQYDDFLVGMESRNGASVEIIADSAPSRPPIPTESGHPFRFKSATCSD
jgi:hypothetical protein